MTPLQLASMECANFDEGRCKRIVIRDDGSMFRNLKMPERCLLGQRATRCAYFEECVLPMGTNGWTALRVRNFEEAVQLYWSSVKQTAKPERGQRSCPGCGRPLEPRKQWCYVCAEKRHRESTRTAMAKKRIRLT